jgi:hypothetical protein
MTQMGHFDQFPPAAPSVGCPLDQRTFAEAIRQLPRRAENEPPGYGYSLLDALVTVVTATTRGSALRENLGLPAEELVFHEARLLSF